MTVLAWLQSRTPTPPPAMHARVVEALGSRGGEDASQTFDACLDAAASLLEELLREETLGRESAIDLLAADALVTYAFEAAADDIDRLDDRAAQAMTRLSVSSERDRTHD